MQNMFPTLYFPINDLTLLLITYVFLSYGSYYRNVHCLSKYCYSKSYLCSIT